MHNGEGQESSGKGGAIEKSLTNGCPQRQPRALDGSHVERMTTDQSIFEMPKKKKAGWWVKKSILAQWAKAQKTSEQTVSRKEEQPGAPFSGFILKCWLIMQL